MFRREWSMVRRGSRKIKLRRMLQFRTTVLGLSEVPYFASLANHALR